MAYLHYKFRFNEKIGATINYLVIEDDLGEQSLFDTTGNSFVENFNLTGYHIGVKGLFYLANNTIQPYVFGALNITNGDLNANLYPDTKYSG